MLLFFVLENSVTITKMSLDLYFFNLINNLAGKWEFLDFLGVFFAKYFEYVLLFCLLLFLVYPIKLSREAGHRFAWQIGFNRVNFRKYWGMVLESVLIATLIRFILVEIIRMLYFRPRPFVTMPVHLLLPDYDPLKSSFPSGHASFYFALSTIIYLYNKKFGILFYIGSFLIVIARVFVGVHWPSDILVGALLGIIVGFILSKIFKKFYSTYMYDNE